MREVYFKCANCGKKKARIADTFTFIRCDKCGFELKYEDLEGALKKFAEGMKIFLKDLDDYTRKAVESIESELKKISR